MTPRWHDLTLIRIFSVGLVTTIVFFAQANG
jgi:hypothetical protein